MKTKLLLTSLSLFVGFTGFSQYAPTSLNHSLKQASDSDVQALRKYLSKVAEAPVGPYDFVLSPTNIDFAAAGLSSNGDLFVAALLQDSVGLESTSNGNRNINWHYAGATINPQSFKYFNLDYGYNQGLQQDVNINQWTPYNLDSISIAGTYDQVPGKENVVDTLLLDVMWGAINNNNVFPTSFVNYGTQQAPKLVPGLRFTTSTQHGNRLNYSAPLNTNRIQRKIPLTTADTGRTLVYGINQAIPANNVFAVSITFIPGESYDNTSIFFKYSGGTTDATHNSFRVLFAQDPTYNPPTTNGDLVFHDPTSYQGSFFVYTPGRYSRYTGTGDFLNSQTYGQAALGVFVSARISATITKINEVANSGLKTWDNYPNPANEASAFNYELDKATDVSFVVKDMSGKEVFAQNLGSKTAGVHNFVLNTSNFAQGIYMYTLTTNAGSVTKRMNVVH